nr:immunoglobulin heavy chain junction region [Macaca mulatta]MOV38134.1 immunoglobulin heavy chain junction region [Macaca mulatta]MOV38180.1 immunoglobulin heavy chain junction region [Macaca mulatta]MOV38470.1 immunoglobulin heavy chain junction region [Macaca mulatta]MOV39707.1 immunoglobulin heavy chain junction region [Macaca mulatta]
CAGATTFYYGSRLDSW